MKTFLICLTTVLLMGCASGKVTTITPAFTVTQEVTTTDKDGNVLQIQTTRVPVTPKDNFWHWLFDTSVSAGKKQVGL